MQDPLIPVAVVGIAVDDPAQASRVKRVVGIAAFMMLWTVVSQAYMFSLVHSLGGLLSGLAFGGCVPACGYFGAKQRSKPLVGLFTCCNCCAMLSLGSYIVLTFIALAVFNADVSINGEHKSLKQLINTALPEMPCSMHLALAQNSIKKGQIAINRFSPGSTPPCLISR